MDSLYVPTRPVRAEQYHAGMPSILGRPVITDMRGVTTYQPHTPRNELADGCWVIETHPLILNSNGKPQPAGMATRVISAATFDAEYRAAYPGEVTATA